MNPPSRRELLRRGATASLVPLLLYVRTAFAEAQSDAGVIAGAVGLEEVAVFAYDAALKTRLLDGPTTQLLQRVKSHEEAHLGVLKAALQRLGGTAPPAPASPTASKLLAPLAKAKSQKDVLAFAIALETATVAAYYDAQGKLKSPELLRTSAEVMANEGQHLVVLRKALGRPQLPNAFETGKPSP
ncbi:MAG: putative exported protein [Solirubrobacterales bacterium]|nr:putative exported protein [Solirubrobacterales bacterium]